MRTVYCGKLNASNVGQEVTLCGWVNRRRDLGGLSLIDMRDREGIVQVFFDPDQAEAYKLASELRNEFCIQLSTIYSTHNGILLIPLPGLMAHRYRNGYSLWSPARKTLRRAE